MLALLLIGAGAFIVVYVAIAVIRLPYPFELEWMEGGSVVHVQRVLDGQPLYARPSLAFIPFIYSPFYYYVSAIPARIFGNGYVPLRVVSFVSSIGSLALIALLVHKRTGSTSASFVASCLFAATFKLTGAWFDLARVDSLALFLVLAGAYVLDTSSRFTNTTCAAMLLFLGFFTKQSSAIVAVSLAAAVLLTRRGADRLLLPVLLGAVIAGSVVAMNAVTGGWFAYYVFDVPSRHVIERNALTQFWTVDLGAHLPIALLFSVLGVVGFGRARRDRTEAVCDATLFVGLVMSSYLSRIHSGGYDNVLMPAAAGIAIFFGMGFAAMRSASQRRRWQRVAIVALVGVQFLILAYSPRYFVPTAAGRMEGDQLLRRLAAIEGNLYMPDHPWYAVAAGKSPEAQTMAISDLVRANRAEDVTEALASEMQLAVEQEHFTAFVVDTETFPLRPPNFERHYRLVDEHLSDDELLPPTGMHRAPRLLFIRRSSSR